MMNLPEQQQDRIEIDIRTLPGCWQWVIVLAVIVCVSLIAWLVGRDNPPTNTINWIMNNFPLLGFAALLLIGFGVFQTWRKREKSD
jgi:hypothetical protein